MQWCKAKQVSKYTEQVLLAYFIGLTKQSKSSTIWSVYSMIKLMLRIKSDVDISRYLKLRAFLKKQNEGYVPKKSKIFTREQFEKFLLEADDRDYLGMKVTLIIGIFGACRCDELVKMKVEDVKDMSSMFYINIPDSKTGKSRSFTILQESYLNILRKYIALRPKNMEERRFFVRYYKGSCIRNVIGIHKISQVPRDVAFFLRLPDYKEFTGHCLRRTSATLLVDGGADITCLKRHGGWKSTSVAEGYIEESLRSKNEIANKIACREPTKTKITAMPSSGIDFGDEIVPFTDQNSTMISMPSTSKGTLRPCIPNKNHNDLDTPFMEQNSTATSMPSTSKDIVSGRPHMANKIHNELDTSGFNFMNATLNNVSFNITVQK